MLFSAEREANTTTEAEEGGGEGGGGGGEEDQMETDAKKPAFSKNYLNKLSKAWKERRGKRKKKRLSNKRSK